MISATIKGEKELIAKLEKLGNKALKIVQKELKPVAQAEAKAIKEKVPIGATKWLKRSVKIKKVKKKRKFAVAFRIVCTPPKPKKEGKKARYYAFAPNYGVKNGKKGRGNQKAHNFMQAGTLHGESFLPTLLSNIARGVRAEWQKR
jgi:hypothetical protein